MDINGPCYRHLPCLLCPCNRGWERNPLCWAHPSSCRAFPLGSQLLLLPDMGCHRGQLVLQLVVCGIPQQNGFLVENVISAKLNPWLKNSGLS